MRNKLFGISLFLLLLITGGWLKFSEQRLQSPTASIEVALSYDEYQKQLSKLLQEYDDQLQLKKNSLKNQGEQAFTEELAKSQERFNQNVAAYEKQLTDEAEEIRIKLEERYVKPILNIELKLAMVRLTDGERERLETELRRIKSEFSMMKSEYKQGLQQKLSTYTETMEVQEKQALNIWEEEYETILAKEYKDFVIQLDKQLKGNIDKIETSLRRAAIAGE